MDAGLQRAPGAALSSRVRGSVGPLWLTQARCPGTRWHVPLVPQLCQAVVLSPVGAPTNYGFFFIFLGLFFCFFGSKLTSPGTLEKARLCTGGCCPASPSAQGSEQRFCSGKGTVGRSQTSTPQPSQVPSLEPAIWGTGPHTTPLSYPMGHRRGALGRAAEKGHSSMPL